MTSASSCRSAIAFRVAASRDSNSPRGTAFGSHVEQPRLSTEWRPKIIASLLYIEVPGRARHGFGFGRGHDDGVAERHVAGLRQILVRVHDEGDAFFQPRIVPALKISRRRRAAAKPMAAHAHERRTAIF